MAIPKFLRNFLMPSSGQGSKPIPGNFGEKRAPEGEITKRPGTADKIFRGKPFLRRADFRRALERAPEKVPGVIGSFTEEERIALEEELFPKDKFGEYIAPYEVNKRLRYLKREMYRERDVMKKLEKRKQLEYLEALRGKQEKNE